MLFGMLRRPMGGLPGLQHNSRKSFLQKNQRVFDSRRATATWTWRCQTCLSSFESHFHMGSGRGRWCRLFFEGYWFRSSRRRSGRSCRKSRLVSRRCCKLCWEICQLSKVLETLMEMFRMFLRRLGFRTVPFVRMVFWWKVYQAWLWRNFAHNIIARRRQAAGHGDRTKIGEKSHSQRPEATTFYCKALYASRKDKTVRVRMILTLWSETDQIMIICDHFMIFVIMIFDFILRWSWSDHDLRKIAVDHDRSDPLIFPISWSVITFWSKISLCGFFP